MARAVSRSKCVTIEFVTRRGRARLRRCPRAVSGSRPASPSSYGGRAPHPTAQNLSQVHPHCSVHTSKLGGRGYPTPSPAKSTSNSARYLWRSPGARLLHPQILPSDGNQAETHVLPFPSRRRVRTRALRRPARALRRPVAPGPSPRRQRRRQSPGLAFSAPGAALSLQLAAGPLPRSSREPRTPRAALLARAAPAAAAAAGNILRLLPLLPSRTAPSAAGTADLPAPLAPGARAPNWLARDRSARQPIAGGGGGGAYGSAAKGEAIVDKLASEHRSGCGGGSGGSLRDFGGLGAAQAAPPRTGARALQRLPPPQRAGHLETKQDPLPPRACRAIPRPVLAAGRRPPPRLVGLRTTSCSLHSCSTHPSSTFSVSSCALRTRT